jgi:hypothetical protein
MPVCSVALRTAGGVLPKQVDSQPDCERFVALARLSWSAAERLFLLGTAVADVVEDVTFPEPPAVRGPPDEFSTVPRLNSPATEPPPAAGSG